MAIGYVIKTIFYKGEHMAIDFNQDPRIDPRIKILLANMAAVAGGFGPPNVADRQELLATSMRQKHSPQSTPIAR